MLRITQQDSAKGAKQYYSTADYLSEGQELVGAWGGEGARRLGLNGVVDKPAFDRLCDNLDPSDGKQLTVRTRSDRTVGYDFTFSVPKSMSLLYALTGDEEMLSAFRSAVDETMRDMEAEMKTRVRRNGRDIDRLTGNMVWAEFVHTTSRPVEGVPDPQLHAHCFVFNATWDKDESRWKAGQFRGLKADAPYFQAAFRVRLANKLQDQGFGIDRKRDDFEITGISPAVIKRFSRRTEEIERTAAELGITDPDRKGELGAKTREKKNRDFSWSELRQEWVGRLTDKERQAVATAYRRDIPFARPEREEGPAVDYALAHSFAREATVPERKLLTEAMKRGLGAVTVEGVQRELARRPLLRGEKDGRTIATTDTVLAEEKQVVAFAREGRGKFRPLGNPGRPCTREWLKEGQKAAVRHVLASRDRVTIVRGVAGTGKTTLEQEIGEALSEAGLPVLAMAQTTRAVEVLREEAGFAEADTVARFLRDTQMQASARGGVVLVDEASQLSTPEMAKLFDIARGVEARVVLIGDRRQHRAVARGEPLKLLEDKAGLPVAEVTEILRQSGDYRKAVAHLSEGEVAEGFAELERLGWVKEVADGERYQQLAAAYLAAVEEKHRGGKPATALVVSPTHAEGARITATIRAALKAEKKLGEEEQAITAWVPVNLTEAQKGDATCYETGQLLSFHQNAAGHKKGSRLVVTEGGTLPLQYADRFEVYRPVQFSLAAGDRIRVTAGGKTKDGKHRLSNGSLLTVQGFTKQGDLIVDRGWVIAKDWGHVALGYCVTSHASQGSTVDRVFIGQSSQSFPASSQRQFYVSASRGKKQALVFTDSKKELLKAIDRPDQPLSAIELMERYRRKPSLRQRLDRHLGFMRRLAGFNQTHEPGLREQEKTRSTQEVIYER